MLRDHSPIPVYEHSRSLTGLLLNSVYDHIAVEGVDVYVRSILT